jgi:hypothetical protein
MIRIVLAAASCLLVSAAGAQSPAPRKALPEDIRFCPSWAEAHERTMTSLNNGRRPSWAAGARWKGCVVIKKGTEVEVVTDDDGWSEIVYKKKHWFADQGIFPK